MATTQKKDNHFAFSQAKIKALKLKEGSRQDEYWDTIARHFGVRVSAQSKTFFVSKRVNGTMTRVSVGRFSDQMPVEVARKEAAIKLVEMDAGRNPNTAKRKVKADSKTLEDLFNMKATTQKSQKLKDSTRDFYERTYNLHLSKWNNRRAKEITLEEVTALHTAIGKESPYAANAAVKILRGLLSFQESMDLTYRNPLKCFSEVIGMFAEEPRKVFIEENELPAWYEAVNSLWNDTAKDYLLTLFFTGLRRTEAMKIRWADVDLDTSILTIPAENTKNKHVHVIPIPSPLHTILSSRKAILGGGTYVFASATAKGGHISTIQHIVEELVNNPSVSDFQLHDIRRTFANAAAKLAPWQVVKWLLNHRSKNDVTDRHYVTADIELLRGHMENIAVELLRMATAKPA
jgi:integrase